MVDVISGSEHPEGADIVIIYAAEVVGGMLAPLDDADQAGFFEAKDIPQLAFKATQKIVKEWSISKS